MVKNSKEVRTLRYTGSPAYISNSDDFANNMAGNPLFSSSALIHSVHALIV